MSTIKEASEKLINGEIVIFPTETVYGIGANAHDEAAVAKIFAAKGRPAINPLIVHFYSIDHVLEYFDLTDIQIDLLKNFSPGPLTLIINNNSNKFPKIVTANKNTIGIRIPQNNIARKLIKTAGFPVAAPSANFSMKTSPTSKSHIDPKLSAKCGAILYDDDCDIGLESTIIDTTCYPFSIVRCGYITKEDIEKKLNIKINLIAPENETNPSSPGQLFNHYQADIPIFINRLNFNECTKGDFKIGHGNMECDFNISQNCDLKEMGQNIFKALHQGNKKKLDGTNVFKRIFVAKIENKGIGVAINDKLNRAKKKGR